MRLLLDTHAALWWLSDDDRFGDTAAAYVADETNQILLSAAVVWEVAIKRSLGKLDAPAELGPTLLAAGAHALPVNLEHVATVEGLPWHHRDPFDRMLVAQASVERAAIVSGDRRLEPYGIKLIW